MSKTKSITSHPLRQFSTNELFVIRAMARTKIIELENIIIEEKSCPTLDRYVNEKSIATYISVLEEILLKSATQMYRENYCRQEDAV